MRSPLHFLPLQSTSAALLAFFVTQLLATWASLNERPVTTAILILFGVTLVGAMKGLRAGLAAAILASALYNLLLRNPRFKFNFASAEEFVPLIAFNLSALASALVAGRLRDRAAAAEAARSQIKALFDVSEQLQRAVTIDEIAPAVRGAGVDRLFADFHLVIDHGAANANDQQPLPAAKAFRMSGSQGQLGMLYIQPSQSSSGDDSNLEALTSLISIAVERCLLLQRLGEAELLRRSEDFKTALLSSVSHDLRTPLSAISASASSLRSYGSNFTEEVKSDLLQTIQEQCDRLNRYTSNLLNLGRLQAGLNSGAFVETEVLDTLGLAISRIRCVYHERRIEKLLETQTGVVKADPVMLEQVFYNVLENACRYSPSNSAILVRVNKSEDTLRVQIADEGPGIPLFDRARIFDRFYRSRTSSHQEGSGLGLSIAKGFTEAFGGTISVDTEAAVQGASIIIVLPLAGD